MNTQIFHLNNMTSKVIEGHKSSSNFNAINPTLPLLDGPLMLPPPNCVDISLSQSRYLFPSLSLTLSLYPSLSQSYALRKN